MISIVYLTLHKLRKKPSMYLVCMSFCRVQKMVLNYTNSFHVRCVKGKIIGFYEIPKIDIASGICILRKSIVVLNKKQKNVQNFMLFLFKVLKTKYKGVADFGFYLAMSFHYSNAWWFFTYWRLTSIVFVKVFVVLYR